MIIFSLKIRSVHGYADTDLLSLINDLKREENNVCAHRGLIPGTTQQTFVISVSKSFKTFYTSLLDLENMVKYYQQFKIYISALKLK